MPNHKLIVMDTNCLLQIIARRSKYYYLWENFLNGDYKLCVSTKILEEYEEILCLKANPIIASMVLEIIRRAPNVLMLDVHYRWNMIIEDPDDNKFVDCAIVANADFIVSEDRHFKILSTIEFPKVNVIRLDKFADLEEIARK